MHPDALNLSSEPGCCVPEVGRRLLERMLLLRRFEEKVVELYGEKEMMTPVHLSLGQEAVSAGVCEALRRSDMVFSNHRNHGHYLAKGGDPNTLAAELYGRAGGCSGGKGGSMHVVSPEAGVAGTTAIVGGSIPLAVGAALAFRLRGEDRVAVAFFGDGAADEGALYESMALAALKRLPVLFVLENNFYATFSPLRNRRPEGEGFGELCRLAEPHGIPWARVDGNDAVAVFNAAATAVARARSGDGPSFLEALTCRWKGHVGPDCDTVKGGRPKCEVDAWMRRDPLEMLRNRPWGGGGDCQAPWRDMEEAVAAVVEKAFAFAKSSPYPSPETLYDNVW